MIRLATVFSGIGAIEHALQRMGLEHKIVFACDNGDIEILTKDFGMNIDNIGKELNKLTRTIKTLQFNDAIQDLYKEQLANMLKEAIDEFTLTKKLIAKLPDRSEKNLTKNTIDRILSMVTLLPKRRKEYNDFFSELENGSKNQKKFRELEIILEISNDFKKDNDLEKLGADIDFVSSDGIIWRNITKDVKELYSYLESVNSKVSGVLLKCPKVYDEYCTSNVIVMEYVKYKTINKMELNSVNKDIIVNAINSYIKYNFYAMFNDLPIAFHGDPHSGNLAIDDNGNLWFLDMGLLFVLSTEESKFCREFFLTIYMGDYEKLYNMLIIYGNLSVKQKIEFKKDVKKYINSVRDKNVTHYFIDLIGVCLKYEFVPPSFLFSMGKFFICVYGISNFSLNKVGARELLKDQVSLFLIKKGINDLFVSFNELDENFKKCLDNLKKFITIINN